VRDGAGVADIFQYLAAQVGDLRREKWDKSLLLIVEPWRADRESLIRVAEAIPAEVELPFRSDLVRPHDGHRLAARQFQDEAEHGCLPIIGRDLCGHCSDVTEGTASNPVANEDVFVRVKDECFLAEKPIDSMKKPNGQLTTVHF